MKYNLDELFSEIEIELDKAQENINNAFEIIGKLKQIQEEENNDDKR